MRYSVHGNLVVPFARSATMQTRSFSVVGPAPWNELAIDLRLVTRGQLFFDQQPPTYNPPRPFTSNERIEHIPWPIAPWPITPRNIIIPQTIRSIMQLYTYYTNIALSVVLHIVLTHVVGP